MLRELYIENIAIIKKLSIDFHENLTIFTGETGAGKSIIIDAINLIIGSRGSKSLIRTGEKSCFVSAIFQDISAELVQKLRDLNYNINQQDDLLISREFFEDSKNICRINSRPCTVSILREIADYLINIHGQYDNKSLFDINTQRYLIDKYSNNDEILDLYKTEFLSYQKLKKEFEKFNQDEATKKRQLDILEYQINEIKNSKQILEKEQELINKKQYIKNHKIIKDSLSEAILILDGNENSSGLNVLLSKLEKCLIRCENLNLDKIKNIINTVQDIKYNISDFSYELSSLISDIDFSENDINEIESQLDIIYKLKQKYGSSCEEILDFYNNICLEFEQIKMSDENKEIFKKQIDDKYNILNKLAEKISKSRKQASEKFVEETKVYLKELDLKNIDIIVDIKNTEINIFGKDRLEFLIKTNIGETFKSLSKIASGGEVARVMLAIKNVLSDNDFVGTVIFDEIDIGVSGNTAYNIGKNLKKLSDKKQVISITHSAQVASFADKHLFIKKSIFNSQTFTEIKDLNYEERKYELARILGGAQITDITLKSAQELLDF